MENKLSNIKERVLYLSENVEVNKQAFFKKIGITYGNFTGEKKKRPLNSDAIENILVNYPQTNADWLLTGQGCMLRNNNPIIGDKNIIGGNKNKNTIADIKPYNNDKDVMKHLMQHIEDLIKQINELNTLLKEKDTFIKMLLEQQAVLIEKLK